MVKLITLATTLVSALALVDAEALVPKYAPFPKHINRRLAGILNVTTVDLTTFVPPLTTTPLNLGPGQPTTTTTTTDSATTTTDSGSSPSDTHTDASGDKTKTTATTPPAAATTATPSTTTTTNAPASPSTACLGLKPIAATACCATSFLGVDQLECGAAVAKSIANLDPSTTTTGPAAAPTTNTNPATTTPLTTTSPSTTTTTTGPQQTDCATVLPGLLSACCLNVFGTAGVNSCIASVSGLHTPTTTTTTPATTTPLTTTTPPTTTTPTGPQPTDCATVLPGLLSACCLNVFGTAGVNSCIASVSGLHTPTTTPTTTAPTTPASTTATTPTPVGPTSTTPSGPASSTSVTSTPSQLTTPTAPTSTPSNSGAAGTGSASTSQNSKTTGVSTTSAPSAPGTLPTQQFTSSGPTTVAPTGSDTLTSLAMPNTIVFDTTASTLPSSVSPSSTGISPSLPGQLQNPFVSGPAPTPTSSNAILCNFAFTKELDYSFVVNTPYAVKEIFYYTPKAVQYALNLSSTSSYPMMDILKPYDTSLSGYITTLAFFYLPNDDMVNQLQSELVAANSWMWQNKSTDPQTNTFITLIDPEFPLRAGNLAAAGTAAGSSPTSPANNPVNLNSGASSGGGSGVNPTAVGAGVGAVAGAALYGAIMFYVARRYRKKRAAHSRSSSVIDTSSMVQSHGEMMTGAGSALMAGHDGYYGTDGRISRGSGSSRGRDISAPMMAENSLGWN